MRVLIQRGRGEAGKRVNLDENEIHHLKVRRGKDGETVEVLDGSGFRGTGALVQLGDTWMVDISTAEVLQPPMPVTLAVAAGDRERFSWMVEKLVELGVTQIVPLETARTSGVATRLKDSHLGRLRRSALEAVKQCGSPWAPVIEQPVTLDEFLSRPTSGIAWLADADGMPVPAQLSATPATTIVGPEGGLTVEEIGRIKDAGYQPVSLGSHTLRFETAALAAAAAVTQARMRSAHG